MGAICTIFMLLVGIFAFMQMIKPSDTASPSVSTIPYGEREMQIKSADRLSLEDQYTRRMRDLNQMCQSIEEAAVLFFKNNQAGYPYEDMHNALGSMHSLIKVMKEASESYSKKYPLFDNHVNDIERAENTLIPRAESTIEKFKAFNLKVHALPASVMLDEMQYGHINKLFWESICEMQREEVVKYVSRCARVISDGTLDAIYEIDIVRVLKCVWFFALEKTFSSRDFQNAQTLFHSVYRKSHADLVIAELYAKKKMGGEDVLHDSVRDMLKVQTDSDVLTLIASGLMWMNAYQSENTVLQYMLTTGKEMTAKTQERLHSLTNGGGKAPSGFNVKSSTGLLYFDVSALAWREDEYVGMFENLAFQDKTLAYSLAIRDEDKDLFIPYGINVPSTDAVLEKFKSMFAEEYGSGVVPQAVKCVALSGSGEEKMDGIVVSSNECRQMGILIHIARIGKKLIIKFYTLFMPNASDLAAQKQQALSMLKKLSPSVAMWESSLKDTMLMAVEQLLNTKEDTIDEAPDLSDDPIF